MTTLVRMKCLEPEDISILAAVEAPAETVAAVIEWAKGVEGWGCEVMSARIVKGGRKGEPMTLADFAANIRYSTGEGIYSEDCPALLAAGILRCDEGA